MAAFVEGRPAPRVRAAAMQAATRALSAPLARPASTDIYDVQRELRDTMWDDAGLVRDERGLRAALTALDGFEERTERMGVPPALPLNTAWQDWMNVRNQLTAARLIVAAARERTESRGAHFRRDFPAPDAGALFSVHVQRREASTAVSRQPVALTRATPPAGPRVPAAVEIGD
jgi:succinate dehydrogenase/fumarate reductase flavoprotein subunit